MQGLIDNLDQDLKYALTVEGKKSMDEVKDYEEVKGEIQGILEDLRDRPNRYRKSPLPGAHVFFLRPLMTDFQAEFLVYTMLVGPPEFRFCHEIYSTVIRMKYLFRRLPFAGGTIEISRKGMVT